jgi:hypothetical protein
MRGTYCCLCCVVDNSSILPSSDKSFEICFLGNVLLNFCVRVGGERCKSNNI